MPPINQALGQDDSTKKFLFRGFPLILNIQIYKKSNFVIYKKS